MTTCKLWAALSLALAPAAVCAWEPFANWGGHKDNNFWFVVGVYDSSPPHGHHVSAGLVLTYTHVITSAIPMRVYDDPDKFTQLVAYYRLDRYYSGKARVDSFRIHSDHKDVWSAFDPFSTHSDLAVLKTERMIKFHYENSGYYTEGCVLMVRTNDTHELKEDELFDSHLTHVTWGSLYARQWQSYGGSIRSHGVGASKVVNCKDYIPKEWGLFICIEVSPDMLGCDSGSALTHPESGYYETNVLFSDFGRSNPDRPGLRQLISAGIGLFNVVYEWVQNPYIPLWMKKNYTKKYWIYGICSFAIKRDRMNVFVFTDMTKHVHRNWTLETALRM